MRYPDECDTGYDSLTNGVSRLSEGTLNADYNCKVDVHGRDHKITMESFDVIGHEHGFWRSDARTNLNGGRKRVRFSGPAGYGMLTTWEGAERTFMRFMDNDQVEDKDKMYNITGANSCGFKYPGRIAEYHGNSYLKPGGFSDFGICFARQPKQGENFTDVNADDFNACAMRSTGRVYHCKYHFVYDLPFFQDFDSMRDSYVKQEKYYVKIASLDFSTGKEDPSAKRKRRQLLGGAEQSDEDKEREEEYKKKQDETGGVAEPYIVCADPRREGRGLNQDEKTTQIENNLRKITLRDPNSDDDDDAWISPEYHTYKNGLIANIMNKYGSIYEDPPEYIRCAVMEDDDWWDDDDDNEHLEGDDGWVANTNIPVRNLLEKCTSPNEANELNKRDCCFGGAQAVFCLYVTTR